MNNIIIKGRLSHDPELKACNSGTEVCNFCVAVDRFTKKGKEKQCDFIDCTAWGKTAAFVSQYFSKGKEIVVSGRMESRKLKDKDGNNRVAWGITADAVEFCGGKSESTNVVGSVESPKAAGTVETKSEASEPTEEDLPF